MYANWGPTGSQVSVEEKAKRVVCWFSCGAASACATKLAIEAFSGALSVHVVYCDTGSEHPSNTLFLKDCEEWFGVKVEILKNPKYQDIWDVFQKEKFIKTPQGAICTRVLKREMRLKYERFDDAQVFGFDLEEKKRATDFMNNNPEVMLVTPLIQRGLAKGDCYKMLEKAGIQLPEMYALGYKNNNCIGCVKGGIGYWNKIRVDFPDYFSKMAKIERLCGRTVLALEKTVQGKRTKLPVYLDELDPTIGRYSPPPSCGAIGCEPNGEEEDEETITKAN